MYVLLILVCPFILFLFAIVLSVLRFTDSDYLPLVSSNSSYTWRKFKSEILYNVWNVVTLYKQGLWLWRLIYTFVYHIWNSRLWLDDLLSTLLTQLYVKVDILLTCMWKTFAWPLYFIMKRGDGSMNLFQLRHFLVKCLLKDRNVSQDIDFVSVSTIFRLYFLTVAFVYYICFSFYIWYILRFFFIFFLERLNYVQTHISVSPEFSITNLTNPRYKSTANPYFVKPCVSTWLSLILIYIRINNFPCRTIDFLTRIIFFLLYFQIKLTRADSELVSRIILWISINSNLINYMYKTLKFMF